MEAIIVDAKEGHVMATNAINQFLIWLCIDLTGEPAEAELSPSLVLPCPSSGPEPLYDSFSGLIFFTRNSKIICSDIRNGKTVAVLENAVGTITAWTWDSDCLLVEDRQGQVQERRLCVLVTGDSLGFVRVWDCRRVVEEYSRQCKLNQEVKCLSILPFPLKSKYDCIFTFIVHQVRHYKSTTRYDTRGS